jgi:hypothetical protein
LDNLVDQATNSGFIELMSKAKKTTRKSAVKKQTYNQNELKRYPGSLSEEFQGRVSAIGEQFAGLNQKIDRHHEENTVKFAQIYKQLHSSALTIQVIQEDLAIIKGGLKKKVDYDEFQLLAHRVAALERKGK